MAELLPCIYFHVVLTLPPILRALAMAFTRIVLSALMTAAGDAIDYLSRKPEFLGATVGQLAILHTWRRDLGIHPHVHVLATDGGWDARRQTWVDARRYGPADTPFLLPVDVLLAAFQRRLRRLLLQAYARGDFADGPHEAFPMLATTATFTGVLKRMCATWGVARIEPPFGGPAQLLMYLGAYVNRVAIAPRRVTAYDPATGLVTYFGDQRCPRCHLHRDRPGCRLPGAVRSAPPAARLPVHLLPRSVVHRPSDHQAARRPTLVHHEPNGTTGNAHAARTSGTTACR
jgi:hypothetical protein